MFMEILQPQGDPFAEPQVLTMNHFVKADILKDLSENLNSLLQEFRTLKIQKEHTEEGRKEIAAHCNKLKLYIHRFLLFWSVIVKYCSEQISQSFPSSSLADLINKVVSAVDPICKDKYLQVEYVKFLKILIGGSDENTNNAFMRSTHYLEIISHVSRKDNMLSAQVNSVFHELKKLQCFKLHQIFVETHKELLEKLKDGNPFLDSLLNHNKKMRRSMRKSSQVEDEKASGILSERGSDAGPGNNSPVSGALSSPFNNDQDSHEIKSLKALLFNKKNKSSDDEDDDGGHDIFPRLSNPIRNFNQSPVKPKSPDQHLPSNDEDEKRPPITIELNLSLGKKDYNDDDDEDFEDDLGHPTKRLIHE